MRVAIAADFPSGSNPMGGQSVIVMRERMDDVLRKLGLAVAANATPGQAMQTLATTCKATNCKAVIDGMGHHFVTSVKLDAAGKATLSAQAATGPYFFFAIVRTPSGSMVWDIPANLHSGDNAISLSAANAEVIH
jgi:predicted TIM-barrel fold metal-dependent hydrolase